MRKVQDMKTRASQISCNAKISLQTGMVVQDSPVLFSKHLVDPFAIPFFDCALVANPALQKLLQAPRLPKLLTLSAPAGFGKTAAMVQLHEAWSRQGSDCVWVSPRGAAQAGPLVEQGFWRQAGRGRALGGRGRAAGGSIGNGLADVLSRLRAPVLFLDDWQDCPDAEAAALLNELVFATGPLLRVVVASRRLITLDHGRAALQLNSVNLGPQELALDAESGRVLLAAAETKLDADVQESMLRACEGWPAGLRLMQAAVSRDTNLAGQLDRFARSHAGLAAYYRAHVLGALSTPRLDFLLQLSLLNDITPELAGVATGRMDAGDWLEALVEAGAFITRLDCEPPRYRLHGLFRSFLVAEAKRRLPADQRRALLERAAAHSFQQSAFEDAMEYALAAPAPALVHDILETGARTLVSDRGDLLMFVDWVARASALGVEIGVEAEFWHVWALAFSRRCPRARQRAQGFEQRLAAMPQDEPAVRELNRRMALLRIMLLVVNDELPDARRAADEWLHGDANRSPTHTATAALAAAIAVLPKQNYQEARRYVQMAQVGLHRARGAHLHGWLAATKALIELEQGFPAAALSILDAVSAGDAVRLSPESAMAATLDALRARALLDLGQAEAAREILLRVLRRAAQHGFAETTCHALEAAVGLGDGGESGTLGFTHLDRIAADGSPRLQRVLAAAQIRRLSLMGDAARAREIARQHGLEGETVQAAWHPSEALAISLARIDLLIAEGMARPALKMADVVLRQVMPLGLRREAVELQLSVARAHMLANDRAAAVRAVARAIGLAASRNLVQPFLAQRQVFCDTLRAARLKDLALTISEQISFAQTLCNVTGAAIGQAFGPAMVPAGEVEALTRRELEVLALLESGPSNEQLAEQLLLSLQTVKWHLYNLYAKLGVKNRGAALAKARALKLLPHAA